MKIISAILFGVSIVTRANTVSPPAKIRFSKSRLTHIFNLRDQEIFKVFTDVAATPEEGSELSDFTYSMKPLNGALEDFDLDLSLTAENLGAASKNVGFSGKAAFEGKDFTFSGPIKSFEMKYALDKKYNHDHKYEAWVMQEQPVIIDIQEADLKVEGADLTP